MNTCPNCGHQFPDENQRKGGKKRWAGLSKEERSKAAKKAIKARWDKAKKKP